MCITCIMLWQHSSLSCFPVAKNTNCSQPCFQYPFNICKQGVFDKQGFWLGFNEHCVQLHYLQHHSPLKIYPLTVATNIDTKKESYSHHSQSPASFMVWKSQSHVHFITYLKEFASSGERQTAFRLYTCLTLKCLSFTPNLYLSSPTQLHAGLTSNKHWFRDIGT